MNELTLDTNNDIAIDTPTDNFTGNSASIDIGINFFNAPNFFVGILVGIVLCFLVKTIFKKNKNDNNTPQNNQNNNLEND